MIWTNITEHSVVGTGGTDMNRTKSLPYQGYVSVEETGWTGGWMDGCMDG